MEQLPVRPCVLRSPQRRSAGRAAGVTFGGRDEIGRGVTRRRHQRHREGTKTGAETAATYVRRHRGRVSPPKGGNQISPSAVVVQGLSADECNDGEEREPNGSIAVEEARGRVGRSVAAAATAADVL